jgi:Co/Zn/Cd efflux system component
MLGAVTALIAAVVIRLGGSPHVDAGGSVVVALLLLAGAAKLLRDATYVLLDATPAHLPADAVRSVVLAEPGVADVSQLRVWSLGAGHDAVLVRVRGTGETRGLGARVRERVQHQLGVELCTVEVEE